MLTSTKPSVGIIVACHNEKLYLSRCLESIVDSLSQVELESRVIVILDRCSDSSPQIASKFPVETLTKEAANWKNSYAENLELGFETFRNLTFISVIDADVVVPKNFFQRLTYELERDLALVSVASQLLTEGSTPFNKVYRLYEIAFKKIAIGESLRGACRIYRGNKIDDLYRLSGTPIIGDYIAPDSRLDQKLAGPNKVLHDVRSLHIRRINLSKCIQGQKTAGRARSQLHVSFLKTLLHSIVRLRPFVVVGYLGYHDSAVKRNLVPANYYG